MTRMPSKPRLMRPLFSVRHSPRLTNRNGVLTRIAPPSTAIGTPHQPSSTLADSLACSILAVRLKGLEAPVQRFGRQDHHDRDALQHEPGGLGQVEPALQQAAAGGDAAHQNGYRD